MNVKPVLTFGFYHKLNSQRYISCQALLKTNTLFVSFCWQALNKAPTALHKGFFQHIFPTTMALVDA